MAGLYTWSFRKEMRVLELAVGSGANGSGENEERKKKGVDTGQNSENPSILRVRWRKRN